MKLVCEGMLIGLALAGVAAAEDLVIDDFSYADDAAVQQAWRAAEGSPPAQLQPGRTAEEGTALRMACPFTKDLGRVYYDRDVSLDLTRYGRFTFDFYGGNPQACGGFGLYFRSGAGWYGAGFTPEAGWQKVTLSKAQFGSEDTPAGWSKIDGIRLSQWKGGEGDTYAAIDNLVAHSSEVAVILSTQSLERVASEAGAVESYAKTMQLVLAKAGVDADLVTDEDVAGGGLAERKVAIFAYSPYMAPEVLAQAQQFVAGGGKVFEFFSLDAGMGDLLGIRSVGYKAAQPAGEFAQVVFDAPRVEGLPTKVRQDSWNITQVQPAREDAKVIGWWEDDEGKRAPDPAVVMSDTGVYMAHVLTETDAEAKAQMMTALVGLFVPQVWMQRAKQAIATVAEVGPFTTLDELRQHVTTTMAGSDQLPRINGLLGEAEQALKAAQASLDGGAPAKAAEEADKAHGALKEAYIMSHRPRDGEFRALWEHSGVGAFPEQGWAASIDRIAKAGFNAIVPNMWWAGLAQYDSEYLPHSKMFEEHGDQIAQCVEAAHARGIEVHAWKVNWNLGNAPKEFVDKLRADGRTAVTYDGKPVDWLCASNPANFQLELETMLEVPRKYDVDGIHFDYIRYLDDSICYCDGCRERFQKDTGLTVAKWPDDCYSGALHDRYRDWRCDQITRLVRATSEQARKLKPWLKISAAVFSDYPGCRTWVGQDWVKWVKEGYLDFVCPMDYTDSNAGFRRTVAKQMAFVQGLIPIYPGIGASAPGLPADQVIAQVEIARELGADGFTVFALTPTTAADHIPAMGEAATSRPTYLPHNAPKVVFEGLGQQDPADGAVHLAKAPLAVKVRLVGLGTHRQEVKGLTGTVELQTTYGASVARLGDLPGRVGGEAKVTVRPQEGRLRLAVVGEMQLAEGKPASFVVRSVPFVFDKG